MPKSTEPKHILPFGYRVNEGLDVNLGEFGLINAVGDGNCGPRAIIQSLLIRGVIGGPEVRRTVLDFLHGLFERQKNELDSRGRNLYGCVLRHQSREKNLQTNSCVLVKDQLCYKGFDGISTRYPIQDRSAFEKIINSIGDFKCFTELSIDSPSTIRLTYAELNGLIGVDIDPKNEDQMRSRVGAFLRNYSTMEPSGLRQLVEDYFGDQDDPYSRAAHDDVIYVLAGCLRFDIRAAISQTPENYLAVGGLSEENSMCTHEQALQSLGQLQRDLDFNDIVGYLAEHHIRCTLHRRVSSTRAMEPLVNSDELIMLLPNPERFRDKSACIDISIFRSAAHFMSLLFKEKDCALPRERKFTGRYTFDAQLEILKNRAAQLRQDSYFSEADAADLLYINITAKATEFFDSPGISEVVFKEYCEDHINTARSVLDRFGLNEILGNLALAILGLGVGYAALCLINRVVTGHFLFFRRDAAKEIDQLQDKISKVHVLSGP